MLNVKTRTAKCEYVSFSSRIASVHIHLNGTGRMYINGKRDSWRKIKEDKINCFKLFFKILSVDCYITLKKKKHLKRSNRLLYEILKKLLVS